jgi:magnesium transporter
VDRQAVAIADIEALVESGDRQKLRLVLNDQHPADLAEQLQEMDKDKRLSCFRLLDLDNASAVLAELEPHKQVDLLRQLGDFGVVPIISRMPPDDAADLLAELPRDKVRSIIGQMSDLEAAEDLEELMAFEEESAGGIMSTDYLALNAKMTVEQALVRLREAYEDFEEDIYDAYVVDQDEKLLGRVTLKELLTAPPGAKVDSLMDPDIPTVSTDIDQEDAAEILGRYDLLSLPVVDSEGRLRGIITADDIIDVIQEEAAEDILQSSGIDTSGEAGETLSYDVPLAFKARLPWLIVTLLLETLSAMVINHDSEVVQQTVAAAAFMPLLSGVTGSVAVQSTCIVIQAVSSASLSWRIIFRNLFHEAKVGLLLGTACGVITAGIAFVLHMDTPKLGLVVGSSLFATMMLGVTLGTLMPMIFQKLGIEAAHASGPFITGLLDVCTCTIYLTIVALMLSHLQG